MCLIPAHLFWRLELVPMLPGKGRNQSFHWHGGEEVGGEKWLKDRLIIFTNFH